MDETYERVLKEIGLANRGHAHRPLQCLTVVIQFSHFSVKEFLTSDRLSTSTGGVSHFHIKPEPADTTLVRLLLDRGANVDSEDKERLTPLHLTASDGYTGIVR